MSLIYSDNYTVLDGVTTTTTSAAYSTANRQLKSVQFTAASVTSGNGVFLVTVSNDGTNFVTYNRLTDNVTNTNGQTDTRVGSVTLSANGTKIYFFPVGDYFQYVKVGVTRTTDGTYSATLVSA